MSILRVINADSDRAPEIIKFTLADSDGYGVNLILELKNAADNALSFNVYHSDHGMSYKELAHHSRIVSLSCKGLWFQFENTEHFNSFKQYLKSILPITPLQSERAVAGTDVTAMLEKEISFRAITVNGKIYYFMANIELNESGVVVMLGGT